MDHCDKLRMEKLLGILKKMQETCCTDNSKDKNNVNQTNFNTDGKENLILTLPVIIAETNIDIPIESTFILKKPALDINSMKKNVYLTNSILLPIYEKHDDYSLLNGKLFLDGFIRNKLDFSVAKSIHDNIINLDTESIIVYIPFKCTTIIQYNSPLIFNKEKPLDYIPIYISSDCDGFNKDYSNKKSTHSDGHIPSLKCEIKEVRINETYTLIDKAPFNIDFPLETNFHTIKENIIVNLSITLLQKQDVAMNSSSLQKIKKQAL